MFKQNWKIILLTAGCIHLFSDSKAADQFISKTDITEVKIFTSGATITRNAKVIVDAGQSLLRFENLSASINPSSISVTGTGDLTVLSVTHQLDYLGPDRKTPEMIKLEDSLQSLSRQRDGVLNQITVLQEEQNLLIANKSIGGANTGVKLEELKNIAAFFRIRMTEIKDRILDLNIKEKKLKTEIDKLNQQLSLLNNKRNEPYSTILVNVSAATRTNASFTISYYTGNVSWTPGYDIRVKDSNSPVELLYKAMVNQNTGEDWKNVKVKISTGNPSIGVTKPELYPWYLNFNQPVMIRSSAPGAKDYQRKEDTQAPMMEAQGMQSLTYYVTTVENQLSTDFDISIPYSIPSNGLNISVEIKDFQLPAVYSYYAIPKIDRDAFLVASVTGWQGFDLQAGNSNVYYENTFVGETMFNPVTSNDTLVVSLGRDKRVVIKREAIKDLSGNQILGGNRTRNFTFETTIKNNRKESIKITIEDQLPVSQDKDIEVKLTEGSGGELNDDTGKILWKVEIPAGAQIKKKLGYSVKYPKDRQVFGL
ncbi:MAG TPA: mucoidy inhibitor MuiA family protein [Bacteroidia bacterium]|nr:mucoidy inhibitor MuiA family protein [Bacteroidia bacterium]